MPVSNYHRKRDASCHFRNIALTVATEINYPDGLGKTTKERNKT
jgi:hypothetical protein